MEDRAVTEQQPDGARRARGVRPAPTMRRSVATFSIVALDPRTGEVGVAVASKFLAVGAVVPWARAGVGAVATQAWANLSYGPDGLRLLEQGLAADEVVARLVDADEQREHRQLGVVDARGRAAAWTGRECLEWAGHQTGEGFTCQGNILAGPEVVAAMAETFARTDGALPERLVAALAAGEAAGGDRRGRQSAALYVAKERGAYGGVLDRYVDLRVDDSGRPVDELRRLLELHRFYFPPGVPDVVRLTEPTVREIQEALRRRGFYEGEVTGRYDARTKDAFRRWVGVENLEERWREDDIVDRLVLLHLRRQARTTP